jgi:hypothetical protein
MDNRQNESVSDYFGQIVLGATVVVFLFIIVSLFSSDFREILINLILKQ